MAIRGDGSMWGWGANGWSQLGAGDQIPQLSPMPSDMRHMVNAAAIAAGTYHGVAICGNGLVWAWGSNWNGQLGWGSGEVPGIRNPIRVQHIDVPRWRPMEAVAIAAGTMHNLAIEADGSVWAWGENLVGRLGDGASARSYTPTRVRGPGGVGYLNLGTAPLPPGALPFTDVNPGDWFYPYVRHMYENRVMRGISSTRFAPQETFSRAQIIATLFRIHHGRPADRTIDPAGPHPFWGDVHIGVWYEPYVAWAYANNLSAGITLDVDPDGRGRRFGPNDAVERQEIAAIMHNYIANLTGLPRASTATAQWNAFTDRGQIGGDAFYNALRWANNHEIIRGRSATSAAPADTATRAEAAAMLQRLMNVTADAPPPQPGQQPQIPQLPPQHQPPGQPNPPPPPPASNASPFEQRVLELTNQERARHGLAPLRWNNTLGTAARNHSVDMGTRLFFAHTCPSGRTFLMRGAIAENIAMGQRTPEVVVSRWMESPGHRANILNPALTYLGVGFHLGETRIYPTIPPYFWTQKFG